MLGQDDVRVPPFQGLFLHRQLIERGHPSRSALTRTRIPGQSVRAETGSLGRDGGRLMMFPGNGHALDKVEAEWECFQAALAFFNEHL